MREKKSEEEEEEEEEEMDSITMSDLQKKQEQEQDDIPLIDIADLSGTRRAEVIREIGRACRDWGFFQVVNHGFPSTVMESMWEAMDCFFKLPMEERMQFSSESLEPEIQYASCNLNEKIINWREALFFRCIPGQYQNFKDSPEFCRLPVLNYLKELRVLGSNVYEAIFESLGVNKKDLPAIERAVICTSYYPPSPDPSLLTGLVPHSDPATFTILAQKEVSGLEVLKNGRWVTIKPVPSAFVINLADQIQILSNGEYKSVEHRALRNFERARMSIACFFGPYKDAKIGPLPQLIDETHPLIYKETVFQDYMNTFHNNPLSRKWIVNSLKEDGLKLEKDKELLKYQG